MLKRFFPANCLLALVSVSSMANSSTEDRPGEVVSNVEESVDRQIKFVNAGDGNPQPDEVIDETMSSGIAVPATTDKQKQAQEQLTFAVAELIARRGEGLSLPRGIEGQDLEVAKAAPLAAVAAASQPFIRADNTYGYAGATFDWAAANRVSNIDLIVSDWECDGEPVYAYFLWYDGSRWDETPTHRYDHSGCDLGDNSKYNNLSWAVNGAYIYYMAVVICRDGGPCKVGGISERNPRVPT